MISNRQLILPYAAPYFAFVGLAALPEGLVSSEISYLLRLVAVPLLLWWAWRWYCPLRGPGSIAASLLMGAGGGAIGLVLWLVLLAPFVEPSDAEPWTTTAVVLRLAAAGLVVPVFEELMMRGFIFRLALQWDEARREGIAEPLATALDERSVNSVQPGQWSWAAVLISTLAFTSGHGIHEWPAAMGYGLLMAMLLIIRKDLVTCIAAHATTNIGLALWVYYTGNWQYW